MLPSEKLHASLHNLFSFKLNKYTSQSDENINLIIFTIIIMTGKKNIFISIVIPQIFYLSTFEKLRWKQKWRKLFTTKC